MPDGQINSKLTTSDMESIAAIAESSTQTEENSSEFPVARISDEAGQYVTVEATTAVADQEDESKGNQPREEDQEERSRCDRGTNTMLSTNRGRVLRPQRMSSDSSTHMQYLTPGQQLRNQVTRPYQLPIPVRYPGASWPREMLSDGNGSLSSNMAAGHQQGALGYLRRRTSMAHQDSVSNSSSAAHPTPPSTGNGVRMHFQGELDEDVNIDIIAWRGEPVYRDETGFCVTTKRLITLQMKSNVWIDLTWDKAVRISNYETGMIMSISSCGTRCAMIHPSGQVYKYGVQDGGSVELSVTDEFGFGTYGKMSPKGVAFSSDKCCLIYLVDEAGTRTTNQCFSDLTSGDFTIPTFLDGSSHEWADYDKCADRLERAKYWKSENRVDNWLINGFKITHAPDGEIRVTREMRYRLRFNIKTGNATMSSPEFYCAAFFGGPIHTQHGKKRIGFNCETFTCRVGVHCSGFDRGTKLKIFQ